jgi:hypothetical protein
MEVCKEEFQGMGILSEYTEGFENKELKIGSNFGGIEALLL